MSSHTQSNQYNFAWFDAAMKRLRQGEAAALIEETLEALARNEENARLLQILSMAYMYQGHGHQAEPYARQALSLVSQNSGHSPLHIERAYICLYDSLIAQGRFVEASQTLGAAVSQVPHMNAILLLIAWGYFLAGDMGNAQHTLVQQPPLDQSTSEDQEIAHMFPWYSLMGSYMRYVLEMPPRGPQPYPVPRALLFLYVDLLQSMRQTLMDRRMQAATEFLARWEDEARRHAHNLYGQRLSEILAEVRSPEWHTKDLDRIFPT